jgi:hypothetical protein
MVAMILLAWSGVVVSAVGDLSVLVVGDSFGDTGPTYHALADTFKKHRIAATVASTALGGTTACEWAALQHGKKLVNDAKKKFPKASKGPDYMWFTLGANDQWVNHDFQKCLSDAHNGTFADALKCAPHEVDRIVTCAATLLEHYWAEFPDSKVLFTGYDVPCYSSSCDYSFSGIFYGNFCGRTDVAKTMACSNQLASDVQQLYHAALVKRFAGKPFTAVKFMGAAQKAAGVPGADVGKPIMHAGAKCEWTSLCVHPKYGTPAGDAWTDAFWDKYFKDELHGLVV